MKRFYFPLFISLIILISIAAVVTTILLSKGLIGPIAPLCLIGTIGLMGAFVRIIDY